jgi:hypothetical protein
MCCRSGPADDGGRVGLVGELGDIVALVGNAVDDAVGDLAVGGDGGGAEEGGREGLGGRHVDVAVKEWMCEGTKRLQSMKPEQRKEYIEGRRQRVHAPDPLIRLSDIHNAHPAEKHHHPIQGLGCGSETIRRPFSPVFSLSGPCPAGPACSARSYQIWALGESQMRGRRASSGSA